MTRVQAILEEMRESRGEPTRILADRLLAAHRADLEEALQPPTEAESNAGLRSQASQLLASRRKRYIP